MISRGLIFASMAKSAKFSHHNVSTKFSYEWLRRYDESSQKISAMFPKNVKATFLVKITALCLIRLLLLNLFYFSELITYLNDSNVILVLHASYSRVKLDM